MGPNYIEYKTSEEGKPGGNPAFEALYPQIDFYNGVGMKSPPASAADCAVAGQPLPSRDLTSQATGSHLCGPTMDGAGTVVVRIVDASYVNDADDPALTRAVVGSVSQFGLGAAVITGCGVGRAACP